MMHLRTQTPGFGVKIKSRASESIGRSEPTVELYAHGPAEIKLPGDRVTVTATPAALLAVVCGLVLFGLALKQAA